MKTQNTNVQNTQTIKNTEASQAPQGIAASQITSNIQTMQNMQITQDIEASQNTKNRKRNRKLLFALTLTLTTAFLLVAGVLVYKTVYYADRWYPNTTINGINLSGQTLEESKETLIKAHNNYLLTIKAREEGSLTIDGNSIDYQFNIGNAFDTLYEEQHAISPLFPSKHKYTLTYDVSFSESELAALVKESDLITGSNAYPIIKPKSATVAYSEEIQQYICVEEELGNQIIFEHFLTAIKESLKKAEAVLDITDEESHPDIYKAPTLTSDNDELQTALTLSNRAALRFITWNMGEGVKEQITPTEISQWITYKNGKIKYDNNAMEDWVEAFCLKYKTIGKTRIIKTHNGKKVKIKGGDYGWQLNYAKTLKQAKNALKKNIDDSLTEAYINAPTPENKKALTIKNKVIYANTAYKMNYKNPANDWDQKNYIEISIKKQKVYVFRKGKVVFSCRCITGRPVADRKTPTGAYYIKEHRREYTLTGADYSTPVKNWVRITWSGTGFHPATWQPWSAWTKDMYKTRGSHGCINLAPEDAARIYKLTSYREAVFIY